MYDDDDDDSTVAGGISAHAACPSNGEVSALRQEIGRLKDMLSVASQGTSEARYFELHKRHRELNVKFEAERARTAKLMQQITAMEREKIEAENPRGRGIMLPSQRAGARKGPGDDAMSAADAELDILSKEVEELKSKHERATRTSASLRKANDELKRELGRMKRVLAIEVGDDADAAVAQLRKEEEGDADFEGTLPPSPTGSTATTRTNATRTAAASAAAGGTKQGVGEAGWRGRAQQISLLKSKLKDLQRQLTASRQQVQAGGGAPADPMSGDYDTVTVRTGVTAMTGLTAMTGVSNATGATNATRRDYDDVNRDRIERKEQKRLMDARDMEKLVKAKSDEADRERSRADATQARLQNLERDNQHLRLCVSRLVEKTENDDALITTYREELESQRTEMKKNIAVAGRRANSGGGVSNHREAQLKAEIDRLNDVITSLRRQNASAARKASDPFEGASPIDAIFAAKNINASDDTVLGMARDLIEQQREALIAMEHALERTEQQLERTREQQLGPASMAQVQELIREENRALKERIATVTQVLEREIKLHQSTADHHKGRVQELQQQQDRRGSIGGALPAGRGRPPSSEASTSASTSRVASGRRRGPSADSRGASPPPRDDAAPAAPAAAADDVTLAELEQVKRQYTDLKKAYNSLAVKQQQLEQQQAAA